MIWFSLFLSLLLTAFFAGSEIAYVSANKLLIEIRRKRYLDGSGKVLSRLYEKPAQFLGTMLIGHNIALVVFTVLMTDLLSPIFEPFIVGELTRSLVITTLITILVLVFAEYVPKSIFRMYADSILFALAYPIRFFQILLTPLTWVMTQTSSLILKYVLKASPSVTPENVFNRGDLEDLINSNFIANPPDENSENHPIDAQLFSKALQFKSVRIKKCMIPRSEIVHISADATYEELKNIFVETKLSRIIVTGENVDDVLGYVHHHSMLTPLTDIRSKIMDIDFVPEVMQATDLLNQFVAKRTGIAVVVDEFGSVSGIITLEDILEQIFGDIEDEHDHTEFVEQKISDHEFLFSGRLEIEYLNDRYSLEIPQSQDYHTLSGFLVMQFGDIPKQGEKIILDKYTFIPELVADTRIETVRIIVLQTPQQ
jgi:CBS domain containing-hemolysin-like protein